MTSEAAMLLIRNKCEPGPMFRGEPCWVFGGCIEKDGYGVMTINGRQWRVHRFTYEATIGAIPKGLVIDHLCRVRSCCNPAHLEAVTVGENIRRGETGSHTRAACPKGHAYTAANTYYSKSGRKQVCRACQREWQRRYLAKRKLVNG